MLCNKFGESALTKYPKRGWSIFQVICPERSTDFQIEWFSLGYQLFPSKMKQYSRIAFSAVTALLLMTPLMSEAQCEIFKSEMGDVEKEMMEVTHLSDSLRTFAESAAFGATYSAAREDARKSMILTGLALGAAYDGASFASEAQYQSELCGLDRVISTAIDAQNFSIHARDLMEEAYDLAKKAYGARKLGDINYYMRKSLNAAREAEEFSQKAVYAASDSYRKCNHRDVSLGGN